MYSLRPPPDRCAWLLSSIGGHSGTRRGCWPDTLGPTRAGGTGAPSWLQSRENYIGGALGAFESATTRGCHHLPAPGPPLRSCPAAASWLQPLVVEEWLSRCPATPRSMFPQARSMDGGAGRLPVKPSAKPTQVRTLDLPRESPRSAPPGRDGVSGSDTERERSVTPLAVPV